MSTLTKNGQYTTHTLAGTSISNDTLTIGPGTYVNTVTEATSTYQYASLTKQGGVINLSGSLSLLVEYLEQEPSLWLRLLALKSEEENAEG